MLGGGNRGHSRPLSAASNKGSSEAGLGGGRHGSEPAAASGAASRRPGSAKPSLPAASRTNSAGSVRPASSMSMAGANFSKMVIFRVVVLPSPLPQVHVNFATFAQPFAEMQACIG